jgi:Zn-dependent alcohol dehydrogenase
MAMGSIGFAVLAVLFRSSVVAINRVVPQFRYPSLTVASPADTPEVLETDQISPRKTDS